MADFTGNAFIKALQSDSVTLLVGKNQRQFTISKEILCMKSPFIARFVGEGEGKHIPQCYLTGRIVVADFEIRHPGHASRERYGSEDLRSLVLSGRSPANTHPYVSKLTLR